MKLPQPISPVRTTTAVGTRVGARTRVAPSDCSPGAMTCTGDSTYAVCHNGTWIQLPCPGGSKCRPKGASIVCDVGPSPAPPAPPAPVIWSPHILL